MKNIFRENTEMAQYRPLLTGAFFLHFMVLLMLSGCSASNVEEVKVEPLANMGVADVHRIQSNKLRMIMRTMNMTIYEREATPLDIDANRLRRAEMIAVLLEMISDELVGFVEEESELKLTPEEQDLFVKYASEVGRHGRVFEEIAETERSEAFMPAMRQTVLTCNACHNRFRGM